MENLAFDVDLLASFNLHVSICRPIHFVMGVKLSESAVKYSPPFHTRRKKTDKCSYLCKMSIAGQLPVNRGADFHLPRSTHMQIKTASLKAS